MKDHITDAYHCGVCGGDNAVRDPIRAECRVCGEKTEYPRTHMVRLRHGLVEGAVHCGKDMSMDDSGITCLDCGAKGRRYMEESYIWPTSDT